MATAVQIYDDWIEVDTVEDLHALVSIDRVRRIGKTVSDIVF